MSRFDDDLRQATQRLAAEPLPDGVLDEALDADAPRGWRAALVPAAGVMLLAVLVVGIGLGQVLPDPWPEPSASTAPSPEPSASVSAACENVAAPAGGNDVVLVYFPCGGTPGGPMVSTARPVEREIGPVARLEAAMRALLDGPTDLERGYGLVEVLPAGSGNLLVSVDLAENDGLATLDFAVGLRQVNNLSTTAAGAAFRRAIEATALDLPEVTGVELRLDGSCEAFFAIFESTCVHLVEPLPAIGDCPIITPDELPSGAPVTAPRPYPGQPMVSWGSGEDTVTQLPGHRSSGLPSMEGTPVLVRGYPGYVRPGGDMPLPPPFEIGWEEDGCPYRVFVRLTDGEAAAVDYAGRIGPVMVAPEPPSVPPAVAISGSVDEEGIRLSVTLDRDRTVAGVPVFAAVTIENLGPGSVYWGHSGTCVDPAGVTATTNDPVPLEYGEEWSGTEGILKSLTVDDRWTAGEWDYFFVPENRFGLEGMGCTTDLVISELAAGASLSSRLGWDAAGPTGLPPAGGSYAVTTTFGFMSRGAPPEGDEMIHEFVATLDLPLVVEGPAVDYLTPGEAMDRILADTAFRELFAQAPQTRWVSSRLQFIGDRYQLELYLRISQTESDEFEIIVANVDPLSGIVSNVRTEVGPTPPGG